MIQALKMLILAAVASLFCISCGKDSLPEPTSEGRNTFGCKINGKAWKPDGLQGETPPVWPIEIAFSQVSKDTFDVFIYTSLAGTNEHVQLTLPKAVRGHNALNNSLGQAFGVYYDNEFWMYFTTNPTSGSVNFTKIDPVNGIVSGTFGFEARESVRQRTVKITEGRFDIDIKKSARIF